MTETFPIIRNAPPPCRMGSRGKYPWTELAVGDAFDVPLTGAPLANGDWRVAAILRSACAGRAKRYSGEKYTVRVMDGNVVRCWRVA